MRELPALDFAACYDHLDGRESDKRRTTKDNTCQDKRLSDQGLRNINIKTLPVEDDDDTIDLRALLATVWRRKWVLVLCTLIGGILAYLATSQLEPRYRATATMIFNTSAPNVVDVGQAVTGPLGPTALVNEIEVMRSTRLLERVVDELGLDRDPNFNPFLREYEPTALDWIRSKISLPPELIELGQNLGVLEPPRPAGLAPAPEEIRELELRFVIRNVLSGLSLSQIDGSRVLNISYVSGNPVVAARIVNTLTEQYIIGQLDSKLDAARTATEWLSTRVEELRVRVQEAEEAVELARAAQSVEAGQSLEITQQQLASLNGALVAAINTSRAQQAEFERLSEAVASNQDFGTVSAFRASPRIQEDTAEIEELQLLRSRNIDRVDEDHPFIQRIDERIGEYQARIAVEADRIVEAARVDWLAAQEQVETLEAELRALEDKALEQSRSAVEIRQLEREAQASRTLYENFLSRQKETTAQEDLQSPDARVLTPAQTPLSPLRTTERRTQIAGLLAGALAGLGLIFLLEKLNNTFRSPYQLEELAGLPVLGTVPAVGRRWSRKQVVKKFLENPKSSLAEAVRNLRTSILFSDVDKPPAVVLFTSAVPREGKSTSAVLLAMTSRQMGRSSIIVDCDLRLPAVAQILESDDKRPGLLSVIEGTASLEDGIHIDPATGLHVLMTKPSEPRSSINAADILSSRRFADLIAVLRKKYDRVILDAPPTLVVADARIVASLADAVAFVVRWDSTPRGAVLEGLKELRAVNAPIIGTVMTLVNETKAARYAYQGYSYYRGRYKDYYTT
jgi:capsular exopolysaccharide synthesis family protein